MPKRSAQSQIERYERKIKKLKRLRRIIPPLESSESDNEDRERQDVQEDDNFVLEPISVTPDLQLDAGTEAIIDTEPNLIPLISNQEDEITAEIELGQDILAALGETTSDIPDFGEKIHDNLSRLWIPLLKKGMPKESKEKLLRDYLVPENCKLLQAPKLNAEISAAVPDMVRNRDKVIAVSQQQLGLGITAINRGIDILLKDDNKVLAMKHLSNGCRILCDSHNLVTQDRVKLITPSLDRSILHMITESERDETLFGASLSEKIKAAKAIEKQSLLIKKTAPKARPINSQPSARPISFQGNWPPPPRYQPANRGGRGAYRRPQLTSFVRRPYNASTSQPHRASTATHDKLRAPAQSRR